MDAEYYAKKFVELFPEHCEDYKLDMETYGKILGHVFFGDVINRPLSKLLKTNCDKVKIKRYIDFIEDMYANGNESVQNIVGVTILEYLGDDDDILRNAFSYFSDDLIIASQSIELGLKRRTIKIHHSKGKTITTW
jgi:hypothetical protein